MADKTLQEMALFSLRLANDFKCLSFESAMAHNVRRFAQASALQREAMFAALLFEYALNAQRKGDA